MDSWDFPVSRSPRKELQGPRPTPLKVRKDSHKIRKSPLAPPPHQHQQNSQQPRAPVIIYTVSPKVIHTHPSEFMNLVQRLTGSSSSSSSAMSNPFNEDCGALSPAARYATIEKANKSPGGMKNASISAGLEGVGVDVLMERTSNSFPGILSPGPASLQPISPSFFSAPPDPNSIGSFFYDLSPATAIHGTGNSSFITPSPSQSGFVSPHLTSPSPSVDLFNNFYDL